MPTVKNQQGGKKWRRGFALWFLLIYLSAIGCTSVYNKIYRVGILCGAYSLLDTIPGFMEKMKELGYAEGQNILYDIQKVDNDPIGEKRFITRFVGEKVDLIFAFPNETAMTAKIITQGTDIPVVFAYSGIEGTNLVKSLREPGNNITGVRYPIQELAVKRLELLLEFDPSIQRVWMAYNPIFPLSNSALLTLRPAAQSKGITLVEIPVTSINEIKADLDARNKLADIGMDGILIMPDQLTQSTPSWEAISKFAKNHKLPVSAVFYNQINNGALFHYGNNYYQVGEIAATLVDKILQGTPAGSIPVISPQEYLSINMIRANALGLKVSDGLLKQAEVIIH